jgi:hypothetical protein
VITIAKSEKYLPFPIGSHSNLLPFFTSFPLGGGTRIFLISKFFFTSPIGGGSNLFYFFTSPIGGRSNYIPFG